MKIGFYLLGKKGFCALEEFLKTIGAAHVAFVISARDSGVENDWHTELADLCAKFEIEFSTRNEGHDQSHTVADFSFAIGWRWIIKDATGLIVFHDSLLPKYRGFSPLVNMLIDGVNEIGVTALIASDEYDKGEIVYQAKKKISYPMKISEAVDCILPLYAELVTKTASDILLTGKLSSCTQDERLSSYSLWRDEKDYFVDWNSSAEKIKRFVDAVGKPYLGARSFLNGEIVCVHEVAVANDVVVENRPSCIGKVIFFENACPVIVCGSGLVKITELRTEDEVSLIGHVKFRSRFEGIT